MSREFAGLIAGQFGLLPKTTQELNRGERKIFFKKSSPGKKSLKTICG